MNCTDFMLEELSFIEKLHASSLYQRAKQLSDEIDRDEHLCALSRERDDCYEKATNCSDEEKKKEYLILFREKDDELKSSPLFKEYLDCYSKIRKILSSLSEKLSKELKEL